jgi:Na+/phosphate symporter
MKAKFNIFTDPYPVFTIPVHMDFNPACLINVFLAFLALYFYFIGSYRFFKNQGGFVFFLGLAIGIDVLTALFASLRVTPTVQLPEVETVPWYSLLFKVHVILSMIGFIGFIALFLYLLVRKRKAISVRIRTWQFKFLLPVWVIGESIALANALSKILFRVRIFEYL